MAKLPPGPLASGRRRHAPEPVHGLAPGRRHQPSRRIVGDPRLGPAHRGRHPGVLQCLLGQVEVAENADEPGEDPAPVVR